MEEFENTNEYNNLIIPIVNCEAPPFMRRDIFSTKINEIKDIEEIESKSASNSCFYNANYYLEDKIYPIFIKISDATDRETSYECKIYEYIKKNILETNLSPNFVAYLGHSICPIETLHKFRNLPFREKCNVLMTRRLTNKITLDDLHFENEKDVVDILSQLFYALYILECHKITHNDLHMGNIFIETLKYPVNLSFTIGEKTINITTDKIVYIFDWDRAVCDNIEGGFKDRDNQSFKCGYVTERFTPCIDLLLV